MTYNHNTLIYQNKHSKGWIRRRQGNKANKKKQKKEKNVEKLF